MLHVKKYIILYISLLCLAFLSCLNNKNIVSDEVSKPLTPTLKAAFTGSFIDFWKKENWTKSDWDNQFKEMKGLGMNVVIVQFISYENDSTKSTATWFKSNNDFSTRMHNSLQTLMEAAEVNKMEVYIGLYFSDLYWKNQTNTSWLKLHANRCKFVAREIHEQYNSYASFKGWYIPHEPEPYAYSDHVKTSIFRENFVDDISDFLHQLNNKPVAIAVFFNSALSTPDQYRKFLNELGKANLQVIMLQDGIGVEHVSLLNVEDYYKASITALYKDGNFKGEFWADVEIFEIDNTPTNMNRLEQQIKSAVPYVSKLVSFQHFKHMSWYSTQSNLTRPLLKDYQHYLRQLEK